GPSTDLSDLERLADVSEDEAKEVASLKEAVEALRPEVVDAKLRIARSDADLYRSIVDLSGRVASFDPAQWEQALQHLTESETRSAQVSERAFSGSEIPGVLGDSWRGFVEAAERYIVEVEGAEYPQPDSKCVYCQQKLSEAATSLLRKYRDY